MKASEYYEQGFMRYFTAIAALLLVMCANQMPPSGGPDDTQPPVVVRAEPANAATGQSDLSAITLEFSEWVDPRTAKRSISVYPPIDEGFEIGVRHWAALLSRLAGNRRPL